MLKKKKKNIIKRKRISLNLIRKASEDSVRLYFYKSKKYLYLQFINASGRTIMSINSKKLNLKNKFNKRSSQMLGKIAAEVINREKIDKIFFDRGGKIYHGKSKTCLEEIRKNKIKI